MASTNISKILSVVGSSGRNDDTEYQLLVLANDLSTGGDASGGVLDSVMARFNAIEGSSLHRRLRQYLRSSRASSGRSPNRPTASRGQFTIHSPFNPTGQNMKTDESKLPTNEIELQALLLKRARCCNYIRHGSINAETRG